MTVCKQFFISGRVQGVWYRSSTKLQATALGLTGYARNLADGRVEVLACGDEDMLAELEDWLWQGPEQAQVESIDSNNVESRTLSNFSTA